MSLVPRGSSNSASAGGGGARPISDSIEGSESERKYFIRLYTLLTDKNRATTLKNTYRVLSLKYHPDKGGDEAKFKKMANGYDILKEQFRDDDMMTYIQDRISALSTTATAGTAATSNASASASASATGPSRTAAVPSASGVDMFTHDEHRFFKYVDRTREAERIYRTQWELAIQVFGQGSGKVAQLEGLASENITTMLDLIPLEEILKEKGYTKESLQKALQEEKMKIFHKTIADNFKDRIGQGFYYEGSRPLHGSSSANQWGLNERFARIEWPVFRPRAALPGGGGGGGLRALPGGGGGGGGGGLRALPAPTSAPLALMDRSGGGGGATAASTAASTAATSTSNATRAPPIPSEAEQRRADSDRICFLEKEIAEIKKRLETATGLQADFVTGGLSPTTSIFFEGKMRMVSVINEELGKRIYKYTNTYNEMSRELKDLKERNPSSYCSVQGGSRRRRSNKSKKSKKSKKSGSVKKHRTTRRR